MSDEQDLDLATQDEGTGSGAADNGAGGGSGDGSGQGESFLRVNDRTVYKDRDAVIKALDESGRRIATLAPFEKKLAKYYGEGKYDPETLDQHLAELVTYRKEKAEREAAEAAKSTSAEDAKRFEGMSAEQIKQAKAAETWFKDQAEKLGYVSKASIQKLEEKLAAIESRPNAEAAESQTAMVSEGQKHLVGWLSESNVTLNDTEVQKLASRIQAYVDGDSDLVTKWQGAVKRGDVATAMSIVREATEYALPLVKKGAALAKTGAAAAASAKTKTELIAGTRRPLPVSGSGKDGAGVKKSVLPQHRGIKSPELTARAMAMLEASGE